MRSRFKPWRSLPNEILSKFPIYHPHLGIADFSVSVSCSKSKLDVFGSVTDVLFKRVIYLNPVTKFSPAKMQNCSL